VADYVSGRVTSLPIQAPLNRDPVQYQAPAPAPQVLPPVQPAPMQAVAPDVFVEPVERAPVPPEEAAWVRPGQVDVTDGNLFLPPIPAEPAEVSGAQADQQEPERPGKRRKDRKAAKDEADAVADSAPPKRRSALRVIGSWAREILIVVVGALLASTLLRLFVVQLFEIPSGSMEPLVQGGPDVQTDDRVAVQKLFGYARGDVVVFKDTLNWLGEEPAEDGDVVHQALVFVGLAPDESTGYLIKRVIGTPGDRVACCDAQGRITINGQPLDETSYLYTDPATGVQVAPSNNTFDVVVPKDKVFVLGDHRNSSSDSRCHLPETGEPRGIKGFIPVENIVGTAVARVFPFDRFLGISRPTAFEQIPDATGDPPDTPGINGEITPCVSG
jgi:signal peptidase I